MSSNGGGGGSQESAEQRRYTGIMADISRKFFDDQQMYGLPLGREYAQQALAYSSPERIALNQNLAEGAVMQGYAQERTGVMNALNRLGTGSREATIRTLALGSAADRAGARTMARHGVLDRGMQHQLAGFGAFQGNAGQALSGLGQAASSMGSLAASKARTRQAGGAAVGGIVGALANTALGAWLASDRRMKQDLLPLGTLPSGLTMYEFSYKDDPKKERFCGVMADDVETVHPSCVARNLDTNMKYVNFHALIEKECMICRLG